MVLSGRRGGCQLSESPEAGAGEQNADPYAYHRRLMVGEQLRPRGVHDPRVLEVMGDVPRERFVPEELRDRAFADGEWAGMEPIAAPAEPAVTTTTSGA